MPSKRVFTALVGLPLFILLIFRGSSSLFFFSVLIVALQGQNELYHLLESGEERLQKFLGLLMGALLLIGFYTEDGRLVAATISLFLILILIFRTFSMRDVAQAAKEIGVTFFGLFYVSYFLGYLILIRGQEHGRSWIFFLFLVVWAGDTGAYYLGSRFGKHKLFRKISPKKTWEGAVGGLICSLMASAAGRYFFFPEYDLNHMVILGGGLGLIGQIGDLAESLLKRSAGFKDSGAVFPGHGGVLDRFDSILFASPVLYYSVLLGVY